MRKEIDWHIALDSGMELTGLKLPIKVEEDNTAAITLSGSAVFHKRSKHFGVDWYATKEAVEDGRMSLEWVSTQWQLADLLTKPAFGKMLARFREGLMGAEELQMHFGTMAPLLPTEH